MVHMNSPKQFSQGRIKVQKF